MTKNFDEIEDSLGIAKSDPVVDDHKIRSSSREK